VLALILPIGGLEARVIAALVAAPVLGLAVQIVAIRRAG